MAFPRALSTGYDQERNRMLPSVAVIYALYTVESVGERNFDKIPAQQGLYLTKEARNLLEKRRIWKDEGELHEYI